MESMQFRKLSKEETAEFKKAIRDTYEPFSEINGLWHPVCQTECVIINWERSTFVEDSKDA